MRGKSIEHLLTQTTVFSVWNNKQAIFIHFFPYFVVFSSGWGKEKKKNAAANYAQVRYVLVRTAVH